jgi:outer membrane protein assembly factor BamB
MKRTFPGTTHRFTTFWTILKKPLLCSMVFFGILSLHLTVSAEDWPSWLGPRRDCSSQSNFNGWKGPLSQAWKIPVGEGHSSPIVENGKVYLHTKVKDSESEAVQAFDATSGKLIWNTTYPRGAFSSVFGLGPRGTPATTANNIFTFGVTGILSCLDKNDGKILWQVDTLKEFKAANLFFGTSCSPLIVGDKVVVQVGGKASAMVAFDQKDGKVAWQTKTMDDKSSYSSPILWGTGPETERKILALTQQGLASISAKDGTMAWRFPLVDKLNESSTTPIRMGNTVVASSVTFGSVGLQVDDEGNTQKQLWKNGNLTCYFATPVAISKDHVLMVTGGILPPPQANLHCVEASTGKILWTKKKVGKYHASLIRGANGKILMLEDGGDLVLMEPNPGAYTEIARSKVCGHTWAHPAVANDKVFLRDDNSLICVNLAK